VNEFGSLCQLETDLAAQAGRFYHPRVIALAARVLHPNSDTPSLEYLCAACRAAFALTLESYPGAGQFRPAAAQPRRRGADRAA
jgi:hypothetical protein